MSASELIPLLVQASIPSTAKVYVAAATVTGLPLFLYCLHRSLSNPDLSWISVGLLIVVVSFFPITIPSKKGKNQSLSVTFGDLFVILSLLLYGPEVAATLSVIDGAINHLRSKGRQTYKLLFSISLLSISAYLSGHFFYRLTGTVSPLSPSQDHSTLAFFLALDLSGFVFFTLNSGGIAVAIALSTGRNLKRVWQDDFIWISLEAVAATSVAGLIFLTFGRIDLLTAALVMVPIMLVFYYVHKLNSDRVTDARQHTDQVCQLYHSTIASLAMAIDAKDECTHGHVHRVRALTVGLARLCGLHDPAELEGLEAASLLHDIGKLGIPESILNKPSALSEAEMEKMKQHSAIGADILSSIPFPYPVIPFVRFHHERWDGNGYPEGLTADDIPLGARILSIADCYDALRSHRPYRSAWTARKTLDYIRSQSGRAYDPGVVEILVAHFQELEDLMAAAEKQIPESVLRMRNNL
ncbi:MAG: HD-GYP domain-containing protein [Acidobacteriota bacterium]